MIVTSIFRNGIKCTDLVLCDENSVMKLRNSFVVVINAKAIKDGYIGFFISLLYKKMNDKMNEVKNGMVTND